MSTDTAQLAGEPVSPVRHARKTWLVRHKVLAVPAAVVVIATAATSAAVLLSGPSYPHAWCGPVLAQLHAHETQGTFDANMSALENRGAPVGKLISDGDSASQDEAAADNSDPSSGFSDLTAGTVELQQVGTDLQQLNRDCRQPASAYKSDNF